MWVLRVVFVGLVFAVATAVAIDVGRPRLHNKLSAHKATLGDSAEAQAQAERLDHLRVAAAERETSLADQFAADLDAHVAAKDAAAALVEAAADISADTFADASSVVEAEAVTTVGADSEMIFAMDNQAKEDTPAEAEAGSTTEAENGLTVELLQSLEFQQTAATSGPKHTFAAEKTKWAACSYASKGNAQARLTNVAIRSPQPIRDQSFIIAIDGTYKGPDVTYGSVTLQIALVRGSSMELTYRHSLLLSDVLTFNPFRSGDPLSASVYVPASAFNMYAPAGDYVLTVVFTNQDKLPFACARVDFKLE